MPNDTVSAAATGLPINRPMLEAYRQWLHYEGCAPTIRVDVRARRAFGAW